MSYLYAVRMSIPKYRFSPIKIGFSVEPLQRVKEFTRGPFPTDLITVWPGTREDEHGLHVRFKNYRLCGEWFYPTQELLEFLASYPPVEIDKSRALKKVRAFEERFEGITAIPSVPMPPPPGSVSPLAAIDIFTPPLAWEVDRFLTDLKSRWPIVGGKWDCQARRGLDPDHLLALTGFPESVLNRLPYVYVGMGDKTRDPRRRLRRYRFRFVEDFLKDNPSYLCAGANA